MKCNFDMYNAKLAGVLFVPLVVLKNRKSMWEVEKNGEVLCYFCPESGYIELYAKNPKYTMPD